MIPVRFCGSKMIYLRGTIFRPATAPQPKTRVAVAAAVHLDGGGDSLDDRRPRPRNHNLKKISYVMSFPPSRDLRASCKTAHVHMFAFVLLLYAFDFVPNQKCAIISTERSTAQN
jgi:hypothetical protein